MTNTSALDALAATIADALLASAAIVDGDEADIDVTDPADAYLDGRFDLTVIAQTIVTAGWTHPTHGGAS
jgi:hypothetical protein